MTKYDISNYEILQLLLAYRSDLYIGQKGYLSKSTHGRKNMTRYYFVGF